MQRAEINGRKILLSGEIDYGDGVKSAVRATVIGNVGNFTVRRGLHFMGIRPRWHSPDNPKGRRIDNRECIGFFLKDQQSRRRSLRAD
jgi:hypothetical protein